MLRKGILNAGWTGGLALLAVLLGLVLAPGAALAEGGAGHEKGGGSESSLFSGSLWNAIWALVIFLVLLLVLGRFAWKPVVKMLEEREHKVAAAIAEAEKGRDDAMALLDRHRKRLEQAQAETQRMIEQARLEAAKAKGQIVEEARTEADQARESAVQQIEAARNEAVSSVFAEAAALATQAAGRILQRELRPEDHQRLVEQALDELAERQSRN